MTQGVPSDVVAKELADLMAVPAGEPREGFPRGEDNHNAKLTAADVEVIRASSESNRALAERFGVSHTSIRNVRRGVTWGRSAS